MSSKSYSELFIVLPNRAYPDGGTMFEIRYAYTKILIVTCYLLLQGQNCCYTSAMPSLCLRFRFAPIDGASTDLQRTYNGPTTDLHRKGVERKFSQGSTSKNKFSILPIFYQEKGSFTRIYYLENKLAINFIRIQLTPELCEEISNKFYQ